MQWRYIKTAYCSISTSFGLDLSTKLLLVEVVEIVEVFSLSTNAS
jgi:hypothetical protein